MTLQTIAEIMDSGDLKGLLYSKQTKSLTWSNRKCQIAVDIADALMYLHTLTPKLIHRDIKSHNLLIDSEMSTILPSHAIIQ